LNADAHITIEQVEDAWDNPRRSRPVLLERPVARGPAPVGRSVFTSFACAIMDDVSASTDISPLLHILQWQPKPSLA
jgi:hypothetical protein